MLRSMLVIGLILVATTTAVAQPGKRKAALRPEPTVANFAYGQDSERQRFDFWQAE